MDRVDQFIIKDGTLISIRGEYTDIEVPDNVRIIGEGAFRWGFYLTNVVLPESVTTIESYAFADCGYLRHVNIPNSVVSIGERAFQNSSRLVVNCKKGSYAEKYLKENHIPFVAE